MSDRLMKATNVDDLIAQARPAALYWARKYWLRTARQVEFDDLLQEAWIAVLHAAERYDATLSSFPHFAAIYIRGDLRRYLWNHRTTVRLPESQQNAKARREGRVRGLVCRSLDAPRYADDPSGPSWVDTLAAPDGEDACGLPPTVVEAIEALPSRERDVLLMRHCCDATLAEIGCTLGMSSERARQLEAESLKRLRRAVARDASARRRRHRTTLRARP
jgi:RNA polymerase sigma factor (sigma-70 family)